MGSFKVFFFLEEDFRIFFVVCGFKKVRVFLDIRDSFILYILLIFKGLGKIII